MGEDMDTQKNQMFVGKRMRHELTGAEIKLLGPWKTGWHVQFVKATPSPGHEMYSTFLDTDTLSRKFMEVAE